ncbi:hypothetical protein PG988_003526 [Apiospora saccharicola]
MSSNQNQTAAQNNGADPNAIPAGAGQLILAPAPAANAWAYNDVSIAAGLGQSRLMILPVGGQQLAQFCHNNLQHAVLALPGFNVLVVRGFITQAQITSARPSYINGLLIASRGRLEDPPCAKCARQMTLNGGYSTPFPRCVRLPGHFGGCCANCKWVDHASKCTKTDANVNAENNGGGAGRAHRAHAPAPAPAQIGSAENPIDLD